MLISLISSHGTGKTLINHLRRQHVNEWSVFTEVPQKVWAIEYFQQENFGEGIGF